MYDIMYRYFSLCLLILTTTLATSSTQACAQTTIEMQRAYFTQARKALKTNDMNVYQGLKNKLQTYPLLPYLDIWQAHQELEHHNDQRIIQLLERYHDIPAILDLRIAWVKSLAKRGQWPHVAEQLKLIPYAEQNFPKISLRSAWYNGDKKHAFRLLSKQWRQGNNIHTYAIPFLYPAWKQAGFPSSDDSYARIIHLAKHGNWKNIAPLQIILSNNDKNVLNLWQSAQNNPAIRLQNIQPYMPSKLAYPMIKDALRRLSSSDIAAAWQHLTKLKTDLTTKQFTYLQRKIALRAAKQHKEQAISWLASLDKSSQNNDTRAWYVRMLLMQQKWQQAIHAIQAMPEQQQQRSRWLYWQAHALQALNQNNAAKLLFAQLASGRGYYSFLGAEHLGIPYHMAAKPIPSSSFSSLKKEAYIQRAYEWLQLHERTQAEREWNQGLYKASRQTWLKALQLAASWHWYDRTIQAATRVGAYDALSLRFPLAYPDNVQQIAAQTGINSSLIWSIIRQESVFNTHAISRTGARGLMQLMPKTAKSIAHKSSIGELHEEELFLPHINIELGALYLADLLARFDHQPALAIAAYNAGPTRVQRWQKQLSAKDMKVWVELIPFDETRRYVQQVIAFTKVYDWLLKKPPENLLVPKTSLSLAK